MISESDLALYKVTDDVETAVNEILGFYRVYHSSRYVKNQFVIRMRYRVPDSFVRDLSGEFRDILLDGEIVQRAAFPEEKGDFEELPRLALHFDRVNFGRLRMLIDHLNTAPEDPGTERANPSPVQ